MPARRYTVSLTGPQIDALVQAANIMGVEAEDDGLHDPRTIGALVRAVDAMLRVRRESRERGSRSPLGVGHVRA